jgi:hypothetical protein
MNVFYMGKMCLLLVVRGAKKAAARITRGAVLTTTELTTTAIRRYAPRRGSLEAVAVAYGSADSICVVTHV